MNTQSHILMGAVLFGGKVPRSAIAAALGGFVPDLPMLAIVAYLRMSGHDFGEIFGTLYWSPWWQIANAMGHNFLLWSAVILLSLYVQQRGGDRAGLASLALPFAAAALVHSGADFLLHREDAHMHFWPLSEWRFVSPVSYWDRNHYGLQFSLFEAVLGIIMAALLFAQWKRWPVRIALALCMALYAAVPVFFIFGMPHD